MARSLLVLILCAVMTLGQISCVADNTRYIYDYDINDNISNQFPERVVEHFISTGSVDVKDGTVRYTPYYHSSGEHFREHWTLSGRVNGLINRARKDTFVACRVRGTRRCLTNFGKAPASHIYNCPMDITFKLDVQEVIWVKSSKEAQAVAVELNAIEKDATKKFDAKDYAGALKSYSAAKKMAYEMMPQSMPLWRLRERVELCKCYLSPTRQVEFIGKFIFEKDSDKVLFFATENFPYSWVKLEPTLRVDKVKYDDKRVRLKGALTFVPKPTDKYSSELQHCALTAIDSIQAIESK